MAGISIKDLLKYKKEVELKGPTDKVLKTVWVRLIGDEDVNASAKLARIASTKMRAALRNPESTEYQDQIEPVSELDRESLETVILGARQSRFSAEAYVKVNKEELPKIEEIAIEADAPSLEEQEQFDSAVEKQRIFYEEKIDEYIKDRITELKAELAEKSLEEITEMARYEMSNILPLQSFFDELTAQKLFRGTYEDKACKERAFNSVDEFKETDASIKAQLVEAYTSLELNPDELKN